MAQYFSVYARIRSMFKQQLSRMFECYIQFIIIDDAVKIIKEEIKVEYSEMFSIELRDIFRQFFCSKTEFFPMWHVHQSYNHWTELLDYLGTTKFAARNQDWFDTLMQAQETLLDDLQAYNTKPSEYLRKLINQVPRLASTEIKGLMLRSYLPCKQIQKSTTLTSTGDSTPNHSDQEGNSNSQSDSEDELEPSTMQAQSLLALSVQSVSNPDAKINDSLEKQVAFNFSPSAPNQVSSAAANGGLFSGNVDVLARGTALGEILQGAYNAQNEVFLRRMQEVSDDDDTTAADAAHRPVTPPEEKTPLNVEAPSPAGFQDQPPKVPATPLEILSNVSAMEAEVPLGDQTLSPSRANKRRLSPSDSSSAVSAQKAKTDSASLPDELPKPMTRGTSQVARQPPHLPEALIASLKQGRSPAATEAIPEKPKRAAKKQAAALLSQNPINGPVKPPTPTRPTGDEDAPAKQAKPDAAKPRRHQ
jgi:hypothetical protein